MKKAELTIKERSLLRCVLKEHQETIKDQMDTVSKKDKQSLKKEYDRVDDVIHKLGLQETVIVFKRRSRKWK